MKLLVLLAALQLAACANSPTKPQTWTTPEGDHWVLSYRSSPVTGSTHLLMRQARRPGRRRALRALEVGGNRRALLADDPDQVERRQRHQRAPAPAPQCARRARKQRRGLVPLQRVVGQERRQPGEGGERQSHRCNPPVCV